MRCYFVSSKVRGERNSVIFINREILPGLEDASIIFTFCFNDNEGFQWNSKKFVIDHDYLWNTAVYFDSFFFGI